MTTIGRVFACAVVAASLASLPAQTPTKPAPAKPAAEAPAKTTVFVVAKLGDKYHVLAKDELEAKKKALSDEHEAAVQAYDKEKKAADAAHKKFERAMPKAMSLEVIPGEYQTRDAAAAALRKLEGDAKKADEKKPPEHKKPEHVTPPATGGDKKKKHR